VLTNTDLAELLGVPVDQVRRRLHAPASRGEWVMPVRGLWVPVPPEFRLWGGPPGIELIDAMMGHLGVGYYVGWLTAAGLHGAAHQAPQVFQVGVDRQVRDRTVGRTRFVFAQRDVVTVPTVAHPTRSGSARVSTPAATALDVAADITRAGGVDNAATVILELAEVDTFDIAEVVGLAPLFPAAAGRRVGWILERSTGRDDLDLLQAVVLGMAGSPSRLDPAGAASGEVDPRWRLYLNRELEPDV
jgi:predicted transcriptional regulator of viral defense system